MFVPDRRAGATILSAMTARRNGPHTRRGFLFASGVGALQAAGNPQRIRTAVYGIGHAHAMGKIRALRKLEQFEFVGICEPDKSEPRDHEVLQSVRWLSEKELLQDPSIELIAVESAVKTNLAYAHQALDAGAFVHLDKPPGENWEGLKELLEKAGRRKRVVQMGYQWRYHPAMEAAIEAFREGWLGQVYMVRATINKPIDQATRNQLAAFRGGMMFELGCHMIDRIVEVLGKPKRVTSWMRHDAPVKDLLEDNTLAVLEFDQALAEVYVAAQQPNGGNYRTFEILGTKGTATVRPFSPYRLHVDLKEPAGPYKAGAQKVEFPPPQGPPYQGDFGELADVIRHRKTPRFSAQHDLDTHHTVLKACKVI